MIPIYKEQQKIKPSVQNDVTPQSEADTEAQTASLPRQRKIPFMIIMGLFGVSIAFTVSTLDPFIYNEKVRLLVPSGIRNSTLGFITILALLVALLVQPLVGQWSDRTRSKWGRRTPFLVVGVLGISFSLLLVVMADTLWLLVIAAMLVSGFSNTIQSPWQALIPDRIPEAQRGTAAGIKTVLELCGIIAGVGLVSLILVDGNLWVMPGISITLFFIILGVTLYTIFQDGVLVEASAGSRSHNPFAKLFVTLRHAPPQFLWWMANRFLFWSSAIAIRTFLLNFLEDVMHMTPLEAQSLSSRLFVVFGLGVFILALPSGMVADRIGRRPVLIVAGLLAAAGAFLFIVSRDLNWLIAGGGLIAAGTGIFATTSWALATDLAPSGQGALYLGLANGAGIVGGIGGRLGGPLIDGINSFFDTVALGYMIVFGIAVLFFAGSSLVVLKINEKHSADDLVVEDSA